MSYTADQLTSAHNGKEVVVKGLTANFAGRLSLKIPTVLRGYEYAVVVNTMDNEQRQLLDTDTIFFVEEM